MSKRSWAVWAVVALAAAVSGCGEPVVVPATAPGGIPQSLTKKEEAAEALGEAVPTAKGGNKIKVVIDTPPAEPTKPGETKTTESGVKYETLKAGTGPAAETGQRLSMNYAGTLESGLEFDSSRIAGKPFSFVLGTGAVIRGWDEAIYGMKVGERRKLIVPPNAGYGAQGHPPQIPPNATLIFDVELLSAE